MLSLTGKRSLPIRQELSHSRAPDRALPYSVQSFIYINQNEATEIHKTRKSQ
jgi:hypothetical protein